MSTFTTDEQAFLTKKKLALRDAFTKHLPPVWTTMLNRGHIVCIGPYLKMFIGKDPNHEVGHQTLVLLNADIASIWTDINAFPHSSTQWWSDYFERNQNWEGSEAVRFKYLQGKISSEAKTNLQPILDQTVMFYPYTDSQKFHFYVYPTALRSREQAVSQMANIGSNAPMGVSFTGNSLYINEDTFRDTRAREKS